MKSQGTNCELFLTVGGGVPHSPLFAQCAFAGAARKNRAVHKVGGPVPDSVRSVYDLDADPLAGALGNGLDDRADLFGNAALPADEFSHILGDVYKRQDRHSAVEHTQGALDLDRKVHMARSVDDVDPHALPTVSYTHLSC